MDTHSIVVAAVAAVAAGLPRQVQAVDIAAHHHYKHECFAAAMCMLPG
jgi:hypothetical protein